MSLPHVPDEIAKIIRAKHAARRNALVEEAVSRTLAKIMKSIVEGDVQLKYLLNQQKRQYDFNK